MRHLDALERGPLFAFGDWPVEDVPRHAAGVYTIWDDGGRFVYVGMAGRGADPDTVRRWKADGTRPRGLRDRLNSHASGRRSGDQFCIYVADRLVLPQLSADQVKQIGGGDLSLDALVRDYIREHLPGKLLSPAKRRRAVSSLQDRFAISERRACLVVGQARATERYVPRESSDEQALRARIVALATRFGRYGYRRVAALLSREGWHVNHKRVERLWREEGGANSC